MVDGESKSCKYVQEEANKRRSISQEDSRQVIEIMADAGTAGEW